MELVHANIGSWYIECIPQDGARISVLRFDGMDLLTSRPAVFKSPVNSYGEYEMVLLREIEAGSVNVGYRNGLMLHIGFDIELFPTLGIWWNNSAYPEEKGVERNECAFEPIPGTCSNLSKSYSEGVYLNVEAGKSTSWEIRWEIQNRFD